MGVPISLYSCTNHVTKDNGSRRWKIRQQTVNSGCHVITPHRIEMIGKVCVCTISLYSVCWLLRRSFLFPKLQVHSLFTLYILFIVTCNTARKVAVNRARSDWSSNYLLSSLFRNRMTSWRRQRCLRLLRASRGFFDSGHDLSSNAQL